MNGNIHIEGFKCFLNQDIPISDLTILAGGNSVGKSTVVQSLLLLRSAVEKIRNNSIHIPLNKSFNLSLGNSTEVLARSALYDEISLSYKYGNIRIATTLICDPREPQVFLQLESFKSEEDVLFLGNPHFFHYLNAERLGPRPSYDIGSKQKNVGWQGQLTISLLSSKIVDTPAYNVSSKKAFPSSKNFKLISQVNDWMNHIIPGTDLTANRIEEINQAFAQYSGDAPFNVGFGISYVLPIITAGLIAQEGELFIVENPEAHLHPSGQSRIGAFLARVASDGVQVIIETHSEHVINGIRLAALKREIAHENVVINFFTISETSSQPQIDSIKLNAKADLDIWPKGFFDQQQQDITTIFRLRKENENDTI